MIRSRPRLLYDGDCAFCSRWVTRWQRRTGAAVGYAPYQAVIEEYPQVTPQQCRQAVQLVMPDGSVLSGAHAVLTAMAVTPRHSPLLCLYERVRAFAAVSEWSYRLVAGHRASLSRLTGAPRCDV